MEKIKNMKKIIEKLKWRGITFKDIVYSVFCLGLIIAVTGVMAYSLVFSLASQ